MEFEEFRVALAKLPSDQREALLLVGASGFSYEEAAAICESAVGTIKSRVNRARTRLSKLLSIDSRRQVRPGLHNACRSDRGRTRLIGSSTRCQLLLVETVCWTLPAWGMGDPPERPIFQVPSLTVVHADSSFGNWNCL